MNLTTDILHTRNLYGRSREMEMLSSFVSNYQLRKESFFLIKGAVGVGKTALVNNFIAKASDENYLYTVVAYHGYEPTLAYGALIELCTNAFELLSKNCFTAFKSGLHHLNSSLSEEDLADFCTVFPRLRVYFNHIIAPTTNPDQNRVSDLLSTLLKVISSVLLDAKRKMIFFLDDLHGMDSLSIKFLEKWLTLSITRSIIWIGAVVDDIDLSEFWSTDDRLFLPLEVLDLGGLSEDVVAQYLDDNYPFSEMRKMALVELINQLTKGNPLEIKLLLPALEDVGVLYFDRETESWDYDLEHIQKIDKSNKSILYLIGKMENLSAKALDVISCAAVIGTKFNSAVLQVITKMEHDELTTVLKDCTKRLLIERVPEKDGGSSNAYRFLNWQIRDAAYEKLPEERKRRMHYTLGKTYLASLGNAAREKNIFDIVNQFNRCISYFNSEKDRLELVEMNLQAGKKAKTEEDFDLAQEYFTQAIRLIESNRQIWDPNLVFDVYIQSAEATYLKSDYVSSVMFFESALKYAATNFQKAQVHYYFLVMQNVVFDIDEAWKSGEKVLELLKRPFPSKISKLKSTANWIYFRFVIQRKKLPKIAEWNLMEDQSTILIIATYLELIETAHLREGYSPAFIMSDTFKLIHKNGIVPEAFFFFTCLALANRAHFGNVIKALFYFGLAEDLLARFPTNRFRARVLFIQHAKFNHYYTHVTNCREQLISTFDVAVAAGDHGTASRTALGIVEFAFFEGQSIPKILMFIETYSPFIYRIGNQECLAAMQMMSDALQILTGDVPIENDGLKNLDQIQHVEMKYVGEVSKLFAAIVMQDQDGARRIIQTLKDLNYRSYTIFYHLEKICDLIFTADEIKSQAIKKHATRKLAKIRVEFKLLAIENPSNFSFPFLLADALNAESLGLFDEALMEYRGAIAAASKFQFLHFNAIVHERVASILLKLNDFVEADNQLKMAQDLYLNFGADAKAYQLEKDRYSLQNVNK